MKKFKGNRRLADILASAKAQSVSVNKSFYDKGGDTISFWGGGFTVYYNTFNGNFFGTTPDNLRFSSDSELHEKQPWFQALLNFFYEPT
jgi:hypothetical protein